MADKWEELVAKTEVEPEPNAEGVFCCMTCTEPVYKGYLDPAARTLTWKCSEGHVSQLKNLAL